MIFLSLGAVELSGLKFIQFKTDLIATRVLYQVILSKKRATMSEFVLNEPYTQATSKCRIKLGLETPLGETLVEANSYSIVKINNDG